jgi:(E)-4-hydroxy-3-methylbut-2-enyl-diphosphate synthase
VIGCVVNGPGEARETDIGFTGGGANNHQVYIAGVPHHRLKDGNVVDHLVALIEKKAAEIEAAKAGEVAEAAKLEQERHRTAAE